MSDTSTDQPQPKAEASIVTDQPKPKAEASTVVDQPKAKAESVTIDSTKGQGGSYCKS